MTENDKAYYAIDKRVNDACLAAGHKKVYVDYSAYPTNEDDEGEDWPVDNLDAIAAEGKVILVGFADEFWGGEKARDYVSPVLENPTWLQVCVHANRMILRTRDGHHVFLEGIDKVNWLNDKPDADARVSKWKKSIVDKVRKALNLPEDTPVPKDVTVYEFSMGS